MLVCWRTLLLFPVLTSVIYASYEAPKPLHVNRLSGNQIPIRYELLLQVPVRGFVSNFVNKTQGRVTIQLENKKEGADLLELHSLFHTIHSVTLRRFDEHDVTIPVLGVEPRHARQTIQFNVKKLPVGIYELEIDYSGVISTDTGGLYETAYLDNNVKWRYAIATKGEPTYIRRIVPCFDEPIMRATWQLTLVHPKGTHALSNSKSIHEQEYEGDERYIRTTFDDTPRMSSYLLAFLISDFNVIRSPSNTGTMVGIVYPVGHPLEFVHEALKHSQYAVDQLAETFRVPYTLTKIDHLAVPDFIAGAMENWGLVTYRERYLATPRFGTQNFLIIAHETTHQWFGNLVTAKWWSDLWLHEGFASLYEKLPVEPKKNSSFEQYSIEGMHNTMMGDRWPSRRPMHDETIDTPTQINSHFSYVSYKKASFILNMFRHLLGEEKWYAGLQRYLLDLQFKNANAEDFFNHVAGEYAALFRSFTHQNGFPIVHVRRTPSGVVLRASKYNVLRFEHEELPSTFIIPVFYHISRPSNNSISAEQRVIINGEDTIEIPLGADDVIHVDPSHYGYYLVHYENMDAYQAKLQGKLLSKEEERILEDAIALTTDGYMDVSSFLSIQLGPFHLQLYLNGLGRFFDYTHLNDEYATLYQKVMALPKQGKSNKAYWKHDEGVAMSEHSLHESHSAMRQLLPNSIDSFYRSADIMEKHDFSERSSSNRKLNMANIRCELLSAGNNFENQLHMLEEATSLVEYNEIKEALSGSCLSAADSRMYILAHLNETNYHFRFHDLGGALRHLRSDDTKDIFIDVLFEEVLPNYENRYQYSPKVVETFLNRFMFNNNYHVKKLQDLRAQYPRVFEDYATEIDLLLDQAYRNTAWTTKVGPKILDALRVFVKDNGKPKK